MAKRPQGPRHLIIPDTQVKPGQDLSHIAWAARYAADKLPDVIVQMGDWYDFPSLSSYDRGKKSAEGRRYQDDVNAGRAALALFAETLKKHAPRSYKPIMVVTLGNHENRVVTLTEEDARLEGKVSLDDLAFKQHGWKVCQFLELTRVHGITYAHYYPVDSKGRVTNNRNGCPSAEAQARRMMRSCVAGHRQGLDTAVVPTPGKTLRGIIAGSFYPHEEKYLTPMGTTYWRGLLMLNDIQPKDGEFELCEVSLAHLERRYG